MALIARADQAPMGSAAGADHVQGPPQSRSEQPSALIYARLRAMDALAFEELLLESFERRGHRVIRNRRYTSDGGIDGQVVIEGRA